jgi:hypothetical protein
VALTIKEDRDVIPSDFDQDLSDLEERSNIAEDAAFGHAGYECGSGDSDCDGESPGENTDDGSNADYYYELKFDREERKREGETAKFREA